MGRLILPSRFRGQPQQLPQIDRSTALGRAVSACILGNFPQVEIVGGAFRAGSIGNSVILPPGIAYKPAAGETTYSVKDQRLDFRRNSISVFWYGQIVANATVRPMLSFHGNDYGWELYGAVWDPLETNLNFHGKWQGGSGLSGIDVPAEGIHSFGATSKWASTSSSTGKLFSDGTVYDSATLLPDADFADNSPTFLRLGDADQQMLVCYVFNRELTNEEMGWLHDNPYGLFLRANFLPLEPTGSSDVTVPLTGIAATFSQGTVLPFLAPTAGFFGIKKYIEGIPSSGVSVALTGEEITGAAGQPGIDITVPLIGAQLTGSLGSLGRETVISATGAEATFSQGTISVSIGVSVALTGQQLTGSLGELVPDSVIPVTGEPGVFSQGTVVASIGVIVPLTGVALNSSTGVIAPETEKNLTGVELTGLAGNIGIDITVPLAGQEMTAAQGALVLEIAPALSGEQLAGLLGAARIDITVPLAGTESGFIQGGVTPSIGVTVPLTGQAATFSQENLTKALTVPLAGTQSAFGLGAVTPITGITVALTGQQLTGSLGELVPDSVIPVTGEPGVFSQGTVVAATLVTAELTGLELSGNIGQLSIDVTVPLVGEGLVFSQGNLLPVEDIVVALTGEEMAFTQGNIGVNAALPLTGIEALLFSGIITTNGGETPAPAGSGPILRVNAESRPGQRNTARTVSNTGKRYTGGNTTRPHNTRGGRSTPQN